jgi:hypothetical protein
MSSSSLVVMVVPFCAVALLLSEWSNVPNVAAALACGEQRVVLKKYHAPAVAELGSH